MSKAKLGVGEGLVQAYRLFHKEFNPKADVIYYPGCGYDISASKAFPNSRVIYVDNNPEVHQALVQGGLEAYCTDANDFEVEGGVDIVIMRNQDVKVDKPVSNLKKKGFVLCNDYHHAASQLNSMPEYDFLAVIRLDPSAGKLTVDKERLGDFWAKVETDAELKAAPFSWTIISYDDALRVVMVVTGQGLNVASNYERIYREALEQWRRIHPESISDTPPITVGDKYFVLSPLPTKKGTSDDLHIFQKH